MSDSAVTGPAVCLSERQLRDIDAYWRAANYLSVGQIYLLDNPLLREPLKLEHIKPRLLGHWGTTPGLNFIYAHLNRVIRAARPERDLRDRPGPRRPGRWSPTSTSRAPTARSTRTSATTRRGCAGCSASSPSRAASRATSPRETPGLDPRGRRARLLAAHAYGAVFDNPDLLACCVVGDGEAETGAAGHELALQQVPEPGARRRGAADPAPQRLQDRQPDGARADPRGGAARAAARATATRPRFVAGDEPATMHQLMAATLDEVIDEIAQIQRRAREDGDSDAAALADDRAAHAQGLDRPEGRRRPAGRGDVSRPPGAARGSRGQPRAPGAARAVDALLPARGAVRQSGRAAPGARRAWRPRASGAWAPTRTPTAACCCAT